MLSLFKSRRRKQLPTLPHDVHVKIIREVLRDFSWVLESNWRVMQVFYVCSAWKMEAQRFFYGSIPLSLMYLTGRIPEFFNTIERFPHLGLLVRQIFSLTCEVSRMTLEHLPLMPNLQGMYGLDWSPPIAKLVPPANFARPALQSLQTTLQERDNPRRSAPIRLGNLKTLSACFTFDNLVRADISGRMRPSRFLVDSVIVCLPTSLKELVLMQYDDGDIGPVLDHVKRFKYLTTLEVYPGDIQTEGRFDPLALFPALRRLAFSHPDPAFILNGGHPTLETLILGQPPIVPNDPTGMDVPFMDAGFADLEYDVVRPALDRLCALLRADRARFPALREVALLPGGDPHQLRVSFEEPQGRRAEGVREVAWKLKDVGLTFLDEEGRVWQESWYKESGSRGWRS